MENTMRTYYKNRPVKVCGENYTNHRSKLCEDAETFNAEPNIFATWL